MSFLAGPRLYYSLFGARGLLLGARARLLRRRIEVSVAVPGVRHPVFLRARTTDVAVCRDILLDSQYDWQFSKSPQVIVDAGANVGIASIFYANKYPDSRIIAIEPELSNFEMLRRNAAPYSNISPVHAALWMEDRQLQILDPGTGHTTFRVLDSHESSSRPKCPLIRGITLSTLLADFGIEYVDLLKLDIEGAEKEVFERSDSWIANVGVIAVELHDWIRSGCSQSVRMATKSFELEWRKGETTYFARKDHTSNGTSPIRASVGQSSTAHKPVAWKFPLRILNTR